MASPRRIAPPVCPSCGRRRNGNTLSPMELRVVDLMAKGYSDSFIAGRLFVSRSSVKRHKQGIRNKLGVPQEDETVDVRVRTVISWLQKQGRLGPVGEVD